MQTLARSLALALLAGAASAASAAELVVAWAPLAVAVDGYQVERRVGSTGDEFVPIARVGSDATRFTDRSVTAGVRYCYRVRGVRELRRSPPSPPLCNVATERAAPDATGGAVEPPAPASAVEPDATARVVVRDAAASAVVREANAATGVAITAPNAGAAAGAGDAARSALPAAPGTTLAVPIPAPAAVAEPESRAPAGGVAVVSDSRAAGPAESGDGFREVKALRRPPPRYPPDAQLRGLSGWVKLIFTVAADGTTRDIRVTAADPPGVFDAAAIEAAQRFQYSPRLENGSPVDRRNVETEITFTWIDRGGSLITDRRSQAPR